MFDADALALFHGKVVESIGFDGSCNDLAVHFEDGSEIRFCQRAYNGEVEAFLTGRLWNETESRVIVSE